MFGKNSRSGWRGSLFGGSMQTAIGVLVLLFTIGVFGFVIRDAIVSSSKDKTGAKRIIATRWNERTLVFPIEGVDKSNRHVVFDVVVLTKDYGWVRGSTTELEKGERRLSPDEIQNEVLAPQLRKGLGSARALIAVGLASQEGDVSREEQRGGLRAIRTAELVRGAVRLVDPDVDAEPGTLRRALRRMRGRGHELATPVYRHRGPPGRQWRPHFRSPRRCHVEHAKPAEPVPLLDICIREVHEVSHRAADAACSASQRRRARLPHQLNSTG